MLHHIKFPAKPQAVTDKLDRIALYLTERRANLPIQTRHIVEWENINEAIGIIEAAKKRVYEEIHS